VAATRTRADAVRNYERVLAAASEVLAEKGAEAGIPEIAARAGVGKGTVYRCFETKEHLVAAVLAEWVWSWTETIAAATDRPDAWEAFTDLLADSGERQSRDCTFSDGLGHDSTLPALAEAKAVMYGELDRLMARAQEQGRMRPGATSQDLRVLFAGMAHTLRSDGIRDPAVWRRYASLVADAFRAA
jgi:AcrR family transcriptional regulator